MLWYEAESMRMNTVNWVERIIFFSSVLDCEASFKDEDLGKEHHRVETVWAQESDRDLI